MNWVEGFVLGLGLIMAIGAQNSYILSQSVTGKFVAPVILTVILCDVFLISLGVMGAGAIMQQSQWLMTAITYAGIAFLLAYGAMALRSVFNPKALTPETRSAPTLKRAIFIGLAVSLLNPHAYLDTVIILGGIANQYVDAQKTWFAIGVFSASVTWFSLLGWGGKKLAPVLARPRAWQVLDLSVCVMMWSIAASLIINDTSLFNDTVALQELNASMKLFAFT